MPSKTEMICPSGHVFAVERETWLHNTWHACPVCREATCLTYFAEGQVIGGRATRKEAAAVDASGRWARMWLEAEVGRVTARAFA